MKKPPAIRFRPVLLAFSALLLAGCNEFRLPPLMTGGGAYKPVTSNVEVAEMAAPVPEFRPGDLYCKVSKGAAKFGDLWQDFRPALFILPKEGRVAVTLLPVRGSGEAAFQGWRDPVQQKMLFCPVVEGPPDKRISCASVYALDDDLASGIKRTFDIPHAIEGGVISCATSEGALKD